MRTALTVAWWLLRTLAQAVQLLLVALILAGCHFVYNGIPHERLAIYCFATVVLGCTAVALFARYLLQKCRRDAWWNGRAGCDETSAELSSLRRIQAELEVLSEAVFDLADAAGRPQVPPAWRSVVGRTYASRAAQDDTVPIKRRQIDADTDVGVQVIDRTYTSAEVERQVHEAKAEGFAEGYVSGIARRRDAEGADD